MRRRATKVVGWIEAGGVGANRKMKFCFDAFDSGAMRTLRTQETVRCWMLLKTANVGPHTHAHSSSRAECTVYLQFKSNTDDMCFDCLQIFYALRSQSNDSCSIPRARPLPTSVSVPRRGHLKWSNFGVRNTNVLHICEIIFNVSPMDSIPVVSCNGLTQSAKCTFRRWRRATAKLARNTNCVFVSKSLRASVSVSLVGLMPKLASPQFRYLYLSPLCILSIFGTFVGHFIHLEFHRRCEKSGNTEPIQLLIDFCGAESSKQMRTALSRECQNEIWISCSPVRRRTARNGKRNVSRDKFGTIMC